jgi:flagellar protein FlgJ
MINAADLSGKLAFDANGLNGLKNAAKENSPEAIKGVAKQFEAIFMNMMLKSMREASPQDNPFDNEQSRTFTSMLDQQLSTNLATKGLGLADVLARQLSQGSNPVTNTICF